MKDPNEKELNKDNENDIFKCDSCNTKTSRKAIRQKWKHIPFGDEAKKKYYCGCDGWN